MTLSQLTRAVLGFSSFAAALVLVITLVTLGPAPGRSEVHAQGSGTDVRLEPETITLRVQDGPVELSVMADRIEHHFVDRDVRSDGLGVFQFALHFDPRVVTVSQMDPGSFLASTGRGTSCFSQIRPDDDSRYDFACVSSSPPDNGPQGSGMLARLTLVPVGGGRSDVVLEGEMGGPSGSNGDDIPFKARGSTVTIIGPPAPTVAPGDVRTPTPRPRLQTDGGTAGGNPGSGGNGAEVTRRSPDGAVDGLSVAGGGAGRPGTPAGLLALAAALALAGGVFVLVGRASRR